MNFRIILFIFALPVVANMYFSTQWTDSNLNSNSRPIRSVDKQLVEEVTDVERRTPERYLEGAYTAFTGWHPTQGYYLGKKEENVVNLLKILVLEISDEHSDEQRRYMLEHRWVPSFVRLFDEAVGWEKGLQAGDASGAFEIALDIWQSSEIDTTEDLLATLLRDYSIERGSDEASFHFAIDALTTSESEFRKRSGIVALCLLSDDSYGPAILELIGVYSSRKTARDIEKAYYWMARGEMIGVSVPQELRMEVANLLNVAIRDNIRRKATSREYIGC